MKKMFGVDKKVIYGIIIVMAISTLLSNSTSDGAILSLLVSILRVHLKEL